MKIRPFTSIIFIFTFAITMFAGAEMPVLTIDSVEGNGGKLTINYTVTDASGAEFITAGWQFSVDDGETWQNIDDDAIGNNEPKPAGNSFITWDTEKSTNNLADKCYDSVSFRMFVASLELGRNNWERKSLMNAARWGPATAVVDGKIYAIGGEYTNGSVEEYAPKTDTWRKGLKPMPTARSHLAGAAVDGEIYTMGGTGNSGGGGYFQTVEVYDPKTDTWRTVADMLTGRVSLAAAVVDGKIYAIGGNDSGNFLKTVEVYDPSNDEAGWQEVADMNTVRTGLAAAVVDGKIYAIGGYNNSSGYLNTVEEYNPKTDTWKLVASMNTARATPAAAAVAGKIYVIGGWSGGTNYLDTVEEYNPKTDTWRTEELKPMRTARSGLAAVVVDGKIYAIGGVKSSGHGANEVEEYTPPRESEITTYDSFVVANHIIADIKSLKTPHWEKEPADGAFCCRAEDVDVFGTANTTDGSLVSWILDFARGDNPDSVYTPIAISDKPVVASLLETWKTTGLDEDGIYTLRLRVTGVCDSNAITRETSIVVTLDTLAAPNIQIRSPSDFDFIRSNTTITISGFTEENATVYNAHLLDQNDASFKDVPSDVVIDSSGIISGNVDVGDLSSVTKLKLALVVKDQNDNPSLQGVSNELTVDDEKPQITLPCPTNSAYFNKPPIIFSGTARDTISGVAKVDFHTGFGSWTVGEYHPPVVGDVNWKHSYTPPSKDVILNIKARAIDKVGNEGETTVIKVYYFSNWPTANICEPADNTEVAGLVNILGDADDIDEDYSDFSYKLEYAPGEDAQSGWQLIAEILKIPVRNDLLTQWQTSNLSEGAYTLLLTVKNSRSDVEVKRRNILVYEDGGDDDIEPPTISNFSPTELTDVSIIQVECDITDISGVYDDETGSAGQGVYFIWDNDGNIADGTEVTMSKVPDTEKRYQADSKIPSQKTGVTFVYQIFAYDNDFDNQDESDRKQAISPVQSIVVTGDGSSITSPEADECVHGIVSVIGTATGGANGLKSWILDYAEFNDGGYTEVCNSTEEVIDAELCQWETPALADADGYTLRLRVWDNQENMVEDTVVVIVDNVAPEVELQIDSEGAVGNFTRSDATIHVSGQTQAGASLVNAELLQQGDVLFEDVIENINIDENGTITGEFGGYDLSRVTELKLWLKVADCGENEGEGTSNILGVDNNPPDAKILAPANGANYNFAPIPIAGIASDDYSGVAEVQFKTASDQEWTDTQGTRNWIYGFFPTTHDVVYTIQARAIDNAGNVQEPSDQRGVSYILYKPTGDIISPIDGAKVCGIVSIIGTAIDKNIQKWTVAVNGNVIKEGYNSVDRDVLATWDTRPPVLPGDYTLSLTVENIGNATTVEVNVTVVPSSDILGDVSGDCAVTYHDASLVMQHVTGKIDLVDQWVYGDVTGDGTLSSKDAALIMQYSAGLIRDFPVSAK